MSDNKLKRLDLGSLVKVLNETPNAPMPSNPVSAIYTAWKYEKLEKITCHQRNIAENIKAATLARRDTMIITLHAEDMADLDADYIQQAKDSIKISLNKQEAELHGVLLDNENKKTQNQIQQEKLEQEKEETRSFRFQNDEQIRSMREYLNGTDKA